MGKTDNVRIVKTYIECDEAMANHKGLKSFPYLWGKGRQRVSEKTMLKGHCNKDCWSCPCGIVKTDTGERLHVPNRYLEKRVGNYGK